MFQSELKCCSLAGLYSNEIIEAEVTVPRKVSADGEHISHDVSCSQSDGTVHLNVTIASEDHLLVLCPTKKFIAPGMIVQRHRRDAHIRIKPKLESTNCHFQGVVRGKPNSRVAVSTCNGLVSFLLIA